MLPARYPMCLQAAGARFVAVVVLVEAGRWAVMEVGAQKAAPGHQVLLPMLCVEAWGLPCMCMGHGGGLATERLCSSLSWRCAAR